MLFRCQEAAGAPAQVHGSQMGQTSYPWRHSIATAQVAEMRNRHLGSCSSRISHTQARRLHTEHPTACSPRSASVIDSFIAFSFFLRRTTRESLEVLAILVDQAPELHVVNSSAPGVFAFAGALELVALLLDLREQLA